VVVSAKDFNYQFNEVAQFNQAKDDMSPWLQLVNNPSNIQQYFIINKAGEMFLVDDMKNLHLLLDLNVGNSNNSSSIKLTSFVLHPNFSLRNQIGYSTFYTSHIESLDNKNSTKRLKESSIESELKFDAVITEWQFSSINHQKINLSTKREILRVAVPDIDMTIKQMSFSPYSKSWDDDFGFLYIALNGQEKRHEPLYSGVLLRINPTKFGLRNYTVPKSNPFIKDNDIKDEIYSLGGQDIKQFIWPEKNSDDILLFHRYKGEFLLSLTSIRNDWRNSPPKKIINRGDNSIEDALLYRGSNLPDVRNKLLLLTKIKQEWAIQLITTHSLETQNLSQENEPQLEWKFTPEQLADNSELSFTQNREGEVLILDKTEGVLFQISQEKLTKKAPEKIEVVISKPQIESTSRIYLIFIVIIMLGILLYLIKRKKHSAKAIVRKQFSHIELSDSQEQISFYYRHQKNSDTTIDIASIITCEVRLNNHVIQVINQDVGNGLNHDKEKDLRAIFAKEKVDKMIDSKIRQINISFTDIDNKNYLACLYMRKGSDRVTKKSYSIVIEDLIDWCWIIAEKINPKETKKRRKKVTKASESKVNPVEQRNREYSLHKQALASRSPASGLLKKEQAVTKVITQEKIENQNDGVDDSTTEHLKQSGNINTDLVYALEKLVDLKQQGFLTLEEFNKAKENLLNSLYR
jgi:hypothetical protein